MKNTVWIFSGGASRTAYVAGALYAICKMNLPKPNMIIACSGSAGTSLCYVTKQHEIIKKVWCEELATKKFVNFWRFWKIIDINYLIDVIIRKNNPLDIEAVKKSDIEVCFPLTNSFTGKVEYFGAKTDVDIWDILKAAKMIPFFTNLFSIKGKQIKDNFYSDSLVSSKYQSHIKKAIESGAERIIVIDSHHPEDTYNKNIFSKLYARTRNKEFRKNQLKAIAEIESSIIPSDIEFIKVIPEKKLDMSRFAADKESVKSIFNRGYEDAFNNKKLLNLRDED